jgi:hypothetical protein
VREGDELDALTDLGDSDVLPCKHVTEIDLAPLETQAAAMGLGLVLPEAPPGHSTISRTRRVDDLETHEAVFTWMRSDWPMPAWWRGRPVGIDATTLEANAALRSIVRRDTGESYQDFLTKLAQASASRRRRAPT